MDTTNFIIQICLLIILGCDSITHMVFRNRLTDIENDIYNIKQSLHELDAFDRDYNAGYFIPDDEFWE